MPAMEAYQMLALVYAGVFLLNLALSGLLWYRTRADLHRGLFRVWATGCLFLVLQALPARNSLELSLVYLPGFLCTFSLADLIGRVSGFAIPRKVYLAVAVLAPVLSAAIFAAGAPFWAVALPVSIAVALPVLATPLRALFRRSSNLTVLGRGMMVSSFALGLHDLDYAFLRDKPQFATLGITVALLICFALSITAPGTVLENITEERIWMERQNEFLRRFFANVTHELRTPLTMILAPLESMLAGEFGPLTPIQRGYLEANFRNGLRLLKLINDLLELARLGEGFQKLRPARIDLRVLLEDVVGYARPLAARKHLALELVVGPDSPHLEVDRDKLERVLVNLIANALKFTERGGVTVATRVERGFVEIAVEDTGIGIPPAAIGQLFQRFNQGSGDVARRFGGTGLGLAYAREMVELHGGRITVDSTPGVGSRFVVRLPEGPSRVPPELRESPAIDDGAREWGERVLRQQDYRFAELANVVGKNAEPVPPGAADDSHAVRILVVEDNVEILSLIEQQLGRTFTVLRAEDGEAGLELARRDRPDVVITDFVMPKLDGVEMIAAMRADPRLGDVPIIMLTSRSQVEDRVAARAAGADVYLGKPFSPRELQAAIHQLLEKRGRHVQGLVRAHVEGLEIVSAGLAHEIQNPLNFIKNAQLLIAENVTKLRSALAAVPLDDPTRVATERAEQKIGRMVESAGRGVQRIESVIGVMRRYAREGYPTEPSNVELDDAVTDVAELVAPRGEIACELVLDLGTRGHPVYAVPEDLNQIIRSLVQNAVEAVEGLANGRVEVRTRLAANTLDFEVIDNGPGIPPEDRQKIFSPFYSTKDGSGRGLGLAIVQILVTRAKGTVDVTSAPFRQTTFRVRLPPAPTDAAIVREVAKAAPSAPS